SCVCPSLSASNRQMPACFSRSGDGSNPLPPGVPVGPYSSLSCPASEGAPKGIYILPCRSNAGGLVVCQFLPTFGSLSVRITSVRLVGTSSPGCSLLRSTCLTELV